MRNGTTVTPSISDRATAEREGAQIAARVQLLAAERAELESFNALDHAEAAERMAATADAAQEAAADAAAEGNERAAAALMDRAELLRFCSEQDRPALALARMRAERVSDASKRAAAEAKAERAAAALLTGTKRAAKVAKADDLEAAAMRYRQRAADWIGQRRTERGKRMTAADLARLTAVGASAAARTARNAGAPLADGEWHDIRDNLAALMLAAAAAAEGDRATAWQDFTDAAEAARLPMPPAFTCKPEKAAAWQAARAEARAHFYAHRPDLLPLWAAAPITRAEAADLADAAALALALGRIMPRHEAAAERAARVIETGQAMSARAEAAEGERRWVRWLHYRVADLMRDRAERMSAEAPADFSADTDSEAAEAKAARLAEARSEALAAAEAKGAEARMSVDHLARVTERTGKPMTGAERVAFLAAAGMSRPDIAEAEGLGSAKAAHVKANRGRKALAERWPTAAAMRADLAAAREADAPPLTEDAAEALALDRLTSVASTRPDWTERGANLARQRRSAALAEQLWNRPAGATRLALTSHPALGPLAARLTPYSAAWQPLASLRGVTVTLTEAERQRRRMRAEALARRAARVEAERAARTPDRAARKTNLTQTSKAASAALWKAFDEYAHLPSAERMAECRAAALAVWAGYGRTTGEQHDTAAPAVAAWNRSRALAAAALLAGHPAA